MTSKATIGSAAKERNGLNPKDFVFIAVFGILLFLVFMVFSIIFSANANLCWFTYQTKLSYCGSAPRCRHQSENLRMSAQKVITTGACVTIG